VRRALALAAVLLCSCSTRDSGPATVRVFGLDPRTNSYGYFDARLETLDDLGEMRGAAARLVGGATLVQTGGVDGVRGGSSPSCWFVESNGVQLPTDFDSLAMASAYHGLERARAFFSGLGAPPEALTAVEVLYSPRFDAGLGLIPQFWEFTDNAAYVSSYDGFLLVPHVLIQGVPFFTNQGVLAHEYGHRVFQALVLAGTDDPLIDNGALQGLNEGLSDVFGGTITADPDYIAPSMGDATIAREVIDRDMSVPRVYTDADANLTDPHELGAYVAALLWQQGTDLGDRGLVAQAVIEAERRMGNALRATPLTREFSLLDFFAHYGAALPDDARPGFCTLLHARFAALLDGDPSLSGGICP
jgi:hypothetical protein